MTALSLVYMAITPMLAKRYAPKGRYYAWLIIVIGLVIPFRPQFSSNFIEISHTETATAILSPIGNTAFSTSLSDISLWRLMAVIWVSGVVACFAYQAVKHYRFVKIVRRWSESVTDEQSLIMFRDLKLELGISKQIGLHQCLCIGSPMLIGFAHPCILLPNLDFKRDELYFILKHELVHYKRKDLWYRLLVLIATALHWFNPFVQLMARAIGTLCEISCDNEVVLSTNMYTRQHYSEAIIGVVRYKSKIKTALSTNFYGGKKGVKSRIFSIMDTGMKKSGIAIILAVLVFTIATGSSLDVNNVADEYDIPVEQAITPIPQND